MEINNISDLLDYFYIGNSGWNSAAMEQINMWTDLLILFDQQVMHIDGLNADADSFPENEIDMNAIPEGFSNWSPAVGFKFKTAFFSAEFNKSFTWGVDTKELDRYRDDINIWINREHNLIIAQEQKEKTEKLKAILCQEFDKELSDTMVAPVLISDVYNLVINRICEKHIGLFK